MDQTDIQLNLAEPGTFAFTGERAVQGHRLNQFALTLKNPHNRDEFRADPAAYMARHHLDPVATALIHKRDWTGLLLIGGHVQTLLFVAACYGENLWHIGAHNAGMSADAMIAACPRKVSGLPNSLREKGDNS